MQEVLLPSSSTRQFLIQACNLHTGRKGQGQRSPHKLLTKSMKIPSPLSFPFLFVVRAICESETYLATICCHLTVGSMMVPSEYFAATTFCQLEIHAKVSGQQNYSLIKIEHAISGYKARIFAGNLACARLYCS